MERKYDDLSATLTAIRQNFLSLSKESSLKEKSVLKELFKEARTQDFLSLSKESSLKASGIVDSMPIDIDEGFLSLSKESSLKERKFRAAFVENDAVPFLFLSLSKESSLKDLP